MLFFTTAAFVFFATATPTRRRATLQPWVPNFTIAKIGPATVGANTFYSSGRVNAQWNSAASIDHYAVTATKATGGVPIVFNMAAAGTITGLESATEYRITLKACVDAACSSSLDGGSATVTTDEEYWQIRGTGSTFATADKIVSDGNTKPWAVRWGADAGTELAGKAQLYYDPISSTEKGIKIGTNGNTPSSASSVASWTALSGYGFHRNDSNGKAGTGPLTFQVVPRTGGKTQLFYEATDSDGHGRIYSIMSTDGWLGRDFNKSTSTICQDSDLLAGGNCAATLEIGIASDGNPHVNEARQFKILLPTLDTWTWDGASGTSMVVTLHFGNDPTCSSTFFNMGFATFTNGKWSLEYGSNGCPKTIPGIQAPMPLHLGGLRYKLYFNHNTSSNGGTTSKPLKLLHFDGATWEDISQAHRVNVLWPSGTLLTDEEKSMFDDYQVWMPAASPLLQVMYSNMSCPNNGCGPPFIGMAVLVNP